MVVSCNKSIFLQTPTYSMNNTGTPIQGVYEIYEQHQLGSCSHLTTILSPRSTCTRASPTGYVQSVSQTHIKKKSIPTPPISSIEESWPDDVVDSTDNGFEIFKMGGTTIEDDGTTTAVVKPRQTPLVVELIQPPSNVLEVHSSRTFIQFPANRNSLQQQHVQKHHTCDLSLGSSTIDQAWQDKVKEVEHAHAQQRMSFSKNVEAVPTLTRQIFRRQQALQQLRNLIHESSTSSDFSMDTGIGIQEGLPKGIEESICDILPHVDLPHVHGNIKKCDKFVADKQHLRAVCEKAPSHHHPSCTSSSSSTDILFEKDGASDDSLGLQIHEQDRCYRKAMNCNTKCVVEEPEKPGRSILDLMRQADAAIERITQYYDVDIWEKQPEQDSRIHSTTILNDDALPNNCSPSANLSSSSSSLYTRANDLINQL